MRELAFRNIERIARESGIDIKTCYGIRVYAGLLHAFFNVDMGTALKTAEQKYASSN